MASIFLDEDFRKTHIFLYYADILDGSTNIEESRSYLILKDDFKFELLLRHFSLNTQLKIRNIKNELNRFVKIINLLILEFVVSKYELENGLKMEDIIQIKNKFGKPKLKNRSYQFNLSDEYGIVSLAIGFNNELKDTEVGVDLANPKDIEHFKLDKLEQFYKDDFRDIFSVNEINELDSKFQNLDYNQRLELLSQYWGLKESYCKYIGVGITAGLQNFEFLNIKKIKTVSDTGDDEIIMNKLDCYKPRNSCFKIPHRNIICSIFAEYDKVCVIKISVEELIDYFIKK